MCVCISFYCLASDRSHGFRLLNGEKGEKVEFDLFNISFTVSLALIENFLQMVSRVI